MMCTVAKGKKSSGKFLIFGWFLAPDEDKDEDDETQKGPSDFMKKKAPKAAVSFLRYEVRSKLHTYNSLKMFWLKPVFLPTKRDSVACCVIEFGNARFSVVWGGGGVTEVCSPLNEHL